MPDFDLDTALVPQRNPYRCPVCDSSLQVVRRYIEEDFADVNEQGEVVGPRDFEIVDTVSLQVLCRNDDAHELELTDEQTAALLEEFQNL